MIFESLKDQHLHTIKEKAKAEQAKDKPKPTRRANGVSNASQKGNKSKSNQL